jgi:hypothetical protein
MGLERLLLPLLAAVVEQLLTLALFLLMVWPERLQIQQPRLQLLFPLLLLEYLRATVRQSLRLLPELIMWFPLEALRAQHQTLRLQATAR